MAAMTTALTEFSDKENSRTYTYTGHTVSKPHLVLQKRKVPSVNQKMLEDTVTILSGTEDSNGDILDNNITLSITCRRPKDGIAADMTAALAILRDIVAGDEYTAVTTQQAYLS